MLLFQPLVAVGLTVPASYIHVLSYTTVPASAAPAAKARTKTHALKTPLRMTRSTFKRIEPAAIKAFCMVFICFSLTFPVGG